jgi:hypothetical protein
MAKNRSSDVAVVGVALVLGSLWLASNPRCGEGCQTMAAHLFRNGWRILLGAWT